MSGAEYALDNHDGFVEELYHLLWVKNSSNQPCPDVMIPDVVIYKYRIPAYWYFTGADGRLRRKNKASIVNQKVFKDFTAGARSDRDVVALHICEMIAADDAPPETVIRYFEHVVAFKSYVPLPEGEGDNATQPRTVRRLAVVASAAAPHEFARHRIYRRKAATLTFSACLTHDRDGR